MDCSCGIITACSLRIRIITIGEFKSISSSDAIGLVTFASDGHGIVMELLNVLRKFLL